MSSRPHEFCVLQDDCGHTALFHNQEHRHRFEVIRDADGEREIGICEVVPAFEDDGDILGDHAELRQNSSAPRAIMLSGLGSAAADFVVKMIERL